MKKIELTEKQKQECVQLAANVAIWAKRIRDNPYSTATYSGAYNQVSALSPELRQILEQTND